MRRLISIATAMIAVMSISAQTIQDAQKEIDNENYFKAKQILFELLNDGNTGKPDVY